MNEKRNQPHISADTVPALPHLPNADGRGSVYFISDGDTIKIGWSGAPLSRLNELQGANSKPLNLLGSIRGSIEDEQAIHRMFRDLHIRGEWFRSARHLLAFIEDVTGRTIIKRPEQLYIHQVHRDLSKWLKRKRAAGCPKDVELLTMGLLTALENLKRRKPWPSIKRMMAEDVGRLAAALSGERGHVVGKIGESQ